MQQLSAVVQWHIKPTTSVRRWLARPVHVAFAASAWLVGAVGFVLISLNLGGPSSVDAWITVMPTMALSHGDLACSYPAGSYGSSLVAPLLPLVLSPLATVTHLGDQTNYPRHVSTASNCGVQFQQWFQRVEANGALNGSLWFGYAEWRVLAGGVVAVLRGSRYGPRVAELVAAMLLAILPALLLTLNPFFHPEDGVALGLAFASLGLLMSRRWSLAGALMVGAVLSQQFALLVVLPAVLLSPRESWRGIAKGALFSTVIVLGPLTLATHGRVLTNLLAVDSTSFSDDSWISNFHMHGISLWLLSRVEPVALTVAAAIVMRRRRGSRAFDGATLVRIAALALSLRVLFEVNLYGYYFMGVGVALIVSELLVGRFRVGVLVWLIGDWWLFNPYSLPGPAHFWSFVPFWLPGAVLAASAVALCVDSLWRTDRLTPSQETLEIGT